MIHVALAVSFAETRNHGNVNVRMLCKEEIVQERKENVRMLCKEEIVQERKELYKFINGEAFFSLRSWPKDMQLIFWKKPKPSSLYLDKACQYVMQSLSLSLCGHFYFIKDFTISLRKYYSRRPIKRPRLFKGSGHNKCTRTGPTLCRGRVSYVRYHPSDDPDGQKLRA